MTDRFEWIEKLQKDNDRFEKDLLDRTEKWDREVEESSKKFDREALGE